MKQVTSVGIGGPILLGHLGHTHRLVDYLENWLQFSTSSSILVRVALQLLLSQSKSVYFPTL